MPCSTFRVPPSSSGTWKGKVLTNLNQWLSVLFNLPGDRRLCIDFRVDAGHLQGPVFSQFYLRHPVRPASTFVLTVVAGYFIFKDQLSLASYAGFTLIIAGILILSLNSTACSTIR